MRSLADSAEHREVLARLRAALDKWIEETNDQGRIPEDPAVAARKGATKADSDPNAGQAMEPRPAEK